MLLKHGHRHAISASNWNKSEILKQDFLVVRIFTGENRVYYLSLVSTDIFNHTISINKQHEQETDVDKEVKKEASWLIFHGICDRSRILSPSL